MIGALCTAGDNDLEAQARENARKHHFDITVAYRYQSSSRHFIGTNEQRQREINHNQIENDYHLFDVAINYELNRRWSLTGSLPVLVATRNQLYSPRGLYHVHGIGDMTAGVRAWIFRPPTESGGNISLGVSLKMPTGKANSQDYAVANGKTIFLFGVTNKKLLSRIEASETPITQLTFSPDRQFLFTQAGTHTQRWEIATGKSVLNFPQPPNWGGVLRLLSRL